VSRNETVGKLIAAAWSDTGFARELLGNTDSALARVGIAIPSNLRVIASENNPEAVHLVLSGPPRTLPRSAYSDIRTFGEVYRGDPRLWSLNWRARDPVARQRLVDNPKAELFKIGVDCPSAIEIVVLVNTADRVHLVLPEGPADHPSPSLLLRLSTGEVPEGLRFGRLFGAGGYRRLLEHLEASPVQREHSL
jgi:hypothetical protein